jgi:tRNA pseudouridine38-40 synthase|tara:strand:- start:227574 stop:228350 length:777 start_codon:yes stop_codon:yes gene_type:complete
MMTKRWKITIEYDGAAFCGWQVQDLEQPSIQGLIEGAIKAFCQKDVRVHVAGRTDAGVHAFGQIAHFDLAFAEREYNGFELTKALNAHLRGHAISIIHAEVVADDFHARFAAKNKLYIYRIVARNPALTVDAGRAWHIFRKLDPDAMQNACDVLIGRHDFTTFRARDCQANSPIRQIDKLHIECRDYDRCGGLDIRINVEGPAFLRHMIRNISGSLAYVGLGKWSRHDLKNALEAKTRAHGGPTAPPHGLYLARVDYK